MFDTIILLTGPVEEAALAAVLRQHNPQLDVRPAKSLDELEAFDQSVLARATGRFCHARGGAGANPRRARFWRL